MKTQRTHFMVGCLTALGFGGFLNWSLDIELWICILIVILALLFNRFIIAVEDESMDKLENTNSKQPIAWYRILIWMFGFLVFGWLIYAVVTQP